MRALAASLIIFLTITLSAFATTQAEVDSLYMQAIYTAEDGDLDTAVSMLESIKKDANDPFIYLKLSEYYTRLSMFEVARNRVMEGLGIFPNDSDLNYTAAQLYLFHFKDTGMAEVFAADAVKNDPSSRNMYLLADIYKILGDDEKLLNVLNTLAETEPSSRVFTERGNIYLKREMKAEAEDNYLRAFELDEDIVAAARLAELYTEKEEYDKAIKYLSFLSEKRPDFILSDIKLAEVYKLSENTEKALEVFKRIEPKVEGRDKVYILGQIANIYYTNNDYKNALKYFKKALELSPNDVRTLYSLGIISEMNGKYKDAETYYHKALNIRSDYVEARKRIGFICLREKRYDEGIKVMQGIPAELMDVDSYRILGALYKDKGSLTKAYEVLRHGFEENPSSVEIVMDFALLLEKQKKYDEAFDVLGEAMELNPNEPSLMNFLGFTYADLGIKLDEAYSLIENALAQDPDNPAYLDSMGWVLYKFEKYEEAYGYQIRALKAAPQEQEIRDHMKAILERLGTNKSVNDVLKEK